MSLAPVALYLLVIAIVSGIATVVQETSDKRFGCLVIMLGSIGSFMVVIAHEVMMHSK